LLARPSLATRNNNLQAKNKEEFMKKFLIVMLPAVILLASCSSGTSPDELWQAQGMWQLTSLGGAAIPNPQNYTLRFSEDGSVAVQADCNRCFGNYETNGNAMTIGPAMGCTRAFCGQDSYSNEYIMALGSATRFVRQGDTLEITYSGGVMGFTVPR
jgi:heat shock protein HslJ